MSKVSIKTENNFVILLISNFIIIVLNVKNFLLVRFQLKRRLYKFRI